MLTLLFIILMFGIFGKMIGLAFRATWVIRLIFLPLVLIGLVLGGLIYIALPLLVIVGIIMLVLM